MENLVFKKRTNGNLGKTVEEALNAHGNLSNILKKGDKVLLKPNFNTADNYPGSTDMEFLKKIVEKILEEEISKVFIGASSTIAMIGSTEGVLQKKKVYDLEKIDKRVKVINFDKEKWVNKEIIKGRYLKRASIPEVFDKVDRLIFLPCLKTHSLSQYTGALKLSMGLIKPRERLLFHAKNLQEKIAELNLLFNPDLVVMDARTCFIKGGPMEGERKCPDFIMSSKSRLSIDIEGVNIIKNYQKSSLCNISAEEVVQIKRAIELNIQ